MQKANRQRESTSLLEGAASSNYVPEKIKEGANKSPVGHRQGSVGQSAPSRLGVIRFSGEPPFVGQPDPSRPRSEDKHRSGLGAVGSRRQDEESQVSDSSDSENEGCDAVCHKLAPDHRQAAYLAIMLAVVLLMGSVVALPFLLTLLFPGTDGAPGDGSGPGNNTFSGNGTGPGNTTFLG